MSSSLYNPEVHHDRPLSIALISPDRKRRIVATSTFAQCGNVQTREFMDYPPSLEEATHMLGQTFDIVLIDLDSNPSFALELVETLCIARSTIVMVFSSNADPELMLRSMRAGAREFFTMPFATGTVDKALQWVSAQSQQPLTAKAADGRLMVFFGSKGGVGVTTLASNFAVALAEVPGKSTILIDLNLQLGDAAMNLGISAIHSVFEALQNSTSLDSAMLSGLITRHSSGLSVLAAPTAYHATNATNVAIGCLLAVARQQFDHVVIDAGKKVDLKQMHLFEQSATAYLVTQVGIPELRNANRLIAQFSTEASPKLEIVINRYQSQFLGITDQHLAKALTQPIQWKIPNDYGAVRKMQSTGVPIVNDDSPIARAVRQMALSACPLPASSAAAASVSKSSFRLPWKSAAQPYKPDNSNERSAVDFRPAPGQLPNPLI